MKTMICTFVGCLHISVKIEPLHISRQNWTFAHLTASCLHISGWCIFTDLHIWGRHLCRNVVVLHIWGRNARGGGGSSICMHIGYVPQERPPFSALNFRSGAYNFHKFPKNPFRSISFSQISKKSVPEHHHFTFFWRIFAVPETIIFKISLISTRSSPAMAGSARTQRCGLARRVLAVPESPIFTLKRIKLVPDPPPPPPPHFHAQNGSSSFRRPPFPRSTGSSFRSPCQFFTLPRHIPTKIWGWVPPPPPRGEMFAQMWLFAHLCFFAHDFTAPQASAYMTDLCSDKQKRGGGGESSWGTTIKKKIHIIW